MAIYGFDPEKNGVDEMPEACPRCGSNNIMNGCMAYPAAHEEEVDPNRLSVHMYCNSCNRFFVLLFHIEGMILDWPKAEDE